jgi:hypothetical protein
MFIDTIALKASPRGLKVKVTTSVNAEHDAYIREQFRKIQNNYEKKNIKIKYVLLEPSREIPHFRKVQIYSKKERCSLWMDRGIDIFRFEDFNKAIFYTLETYVVVEYDQ